MIAQIPSAGDYTKRAFYPEPKRNYTDDDYTVYAGANADEATVVPKPIDKNIYKSNPYIKIVPGSRIRSISASTSVGGSISPIGEVSVTLGSSETFTITPDSGYAIADVKVDGNSVGKVTTYTFSNVTANHTIHADFTATGGSTPSDDDSDSGYTSYPITQPTKGSDTAQTGGSLTLSSDRANPGDTVTATPKPQAGYKLTELTVKDRSGKEIPTTKNADGTFSFKMPNGTVSVTPSFSKIQYYTDVAPTAYHADAAWLLRTKGIMLGTSEKVFSGAEKLNRQQTWMITARINGLHPTDMAAAKAWAVSANVSDGSNATATVSRQQLAVMLYRAAGSPAVTGNPLSGFSDGSVVANYAKSAMNWAVEAGILNGNNGKLNPADPASRANAAVMFTRYLDAVQK